MELYSTNYMKNKNTFPFTTFIVKLEFNDVKVFIIIKMVNYARVLMFLN